jgi:hypothetical protein
MTEHNNDETQRSETVDPVVQPQNGPLPEVNQQYRDVLTKCEKFVAQYRKGDVSKAFAYAAIHDEISRAIGDDFTRAEASFSSFIAAIESHDSEVDMALERGGGGERRDKRRAGTPETDDPDAGSDDDRDTKRTKVDEGAFPWNAPRLFGPSNMLVALKTTLKSIQLFSTDPKAMKRYLTNSPDCPEFPDSEWKNVIAGRAVNLDAVLSGQFSTSNNDVKIEKMGDIEITFGAVEPTKTVSNGGDWTIAWNKTVRATSFAFPHRLRELTEYGEYITSLFAATNQSFHSRIIAFDKAVRRRIGSVRNIELSDHHKFADLKLAHIDSIGVSVRGESSRNSGNRGKNQRGKGGKKQEPCNKWNDGTCMQTQEECRRLHVCNVCEKPGHKGKDCRKHNQ